MQVTSAAGPSTARGLSRSVLLQQGRVLLDADCNEQTQITAQHDEMRTLDVVGRAVPRRVTRRSGSTRRSRLGRPAPDAGALLRRRRAREPSPSRTPVAAPSPTCRARRADGRRPLRGRPRRVQPPRHRRRGAAAARVGARRAGHDHPRADGLAGPARAGRRGRDVRGPASRGSTRTPPTMTASLQDTPAGADPCRITTAEGYRRLENQLYRVQIHAVPEHGSGNVPVVARERQRRRGADCDRRHDGARNGRGARARPRRPRRGALDPARATSSRSRAPTAQLHGLSGFLADAGAPDGLRLPVNWRGSAPTGLTALGRVAARAPLGGRGDRRRDRADRARRRHPGRASARVTSASATTG